MNKPLHNIKHEQFAHNLIKCNSMTKAYKKTYKNNNDVTAQTNSHKLLKREDIRKRVYELLQLEGKTKIESVIENIGDLTQAEKSIVVDKSIERVQDNSTRMEANKVLLKLYGLDRDVTTSTSSPSVNININTQDVTTLDKIAKTLTDMNSTIDMDKDIQDGEIVDNS